MLVKTAHQQFKVGVDKADSLNSPNFFEEEIDLYLSDAQEEFIEQRAYGNNFKRESVEETQQRVRDLQSITVNGNLITFINNANNKTTWYICSINPMGVTVQDSVGVILPEYRHALQEDVDVTYTDCNGTSQIANIPVVALTHDQYNTITVNPFTKPSFNQAYRLPYGRIGNIEYFEIIIPATATLVTYHLRYLKNPKKLNKAQLIISPATIPFGLSGDDVLELTDSTYREVIRIAVRNALGDIESTRNYRNL